MMTMLVPNVPNCSEQCSFSCSGSAPIGLSPYSAVYGRAAACSSSSSGSAQIRLSPYSAVWPRCCLFLL